jgi:hypothetical protein
VVKLISGIFTDDEEVLFFHEWLSGRQTATEKGKNEDKAFHDALAWSDAAGDLKSVKTQAVPLPEGRQRCG